MLSVYNHNVLGEVIAMKEYKIILIKRKDIKKDYAYAEKMMAKMSEEGWDVVSVSMDHAADIKGDMIITFQKDAQ